MRGLWTILAFTIVAACSNREPLVDESIDWISARGVGSCDPNVPSYQLQDLVRSCLGSELCRSIFGVRHALGDACRAGIEGAVCGSSVTACRWSTQPLPPDYRSVSCLCMGSDDPREAGLFAGQQAFQEEVWNDCAVPTDDLGALVIFRTSDGGVARAGEVEAQERPVDIRQCLQEAVLAPLLP